MESNQEKSADQAILKKPYAPPVLTVHGDISEYTLAVGRPGHVKGGGVCWHYDKFGEQSGIPCS
jgi:hypothetical protein